MKKLLQLIMGFLICVPVMAQDNVYPAPPYEGLLFIENATVHVGDGTVLPHTTIQVNKGKIEKIGQNLPIPADDVKRFDATGKHVYPGLILANTNLGIKGIGSNVFGSNDDREIGVLNPNVRSIVAYNTDDEIINTLRSNGILLAQVVPGGGLLQGSSSIVQLDAWTWEDAIYRADNGIHFNMPSLLRRPSRGRSAASADPMKAAMENIELVKDFFREAKIYHSLKTKPAQKNLKFEAVKGLFDQSQTFFVHCNIVKEMLMAIDFVNEFGFKVCLVGASESYRIAPLLKQNNISVIITRIHDLPTSEDDDVDQPFKTPLALHNAGVLFGIADNDSQTRGRNLSFTAGTAAAYGLDKEAALSSITLNLAKILGIDNITGSIAVGKDANLIICHGDILDIRSSEVTKAFIQGREINLEDKHKQLNERYLRKYGLQND